MNSKSKLYHRAHVALKALQAVEPDMNTSREEVVAGLRTHALTAVAEEVGSAAALLVCLTHAGIDPEDLLSDIFFLMDMNPEAEVGDSVQKIVLKHLDDANFAS